MANRVKEDEKNEQLIRGLLKLTENRRCINCNSLGAQYVCTNYWTFVCTTCSGIHREFTHRVKSVSMSKFTSQEVKSLQEGGNKRAKEIYFKQWDTQRHSVPDSSNVERLRDFIRHVYVDRRYSGEKNYDKPPRMKMGDKEDSQGGSRSPPYEDTYERRYNERSSPSGRNDDKNYRYNYDERRSPGYDQESRQYGDYRKSPVRPEVVNDWHREDRFGNGRRFEDRRKSDEDLKMEGRSPERPRDLDTASPPIVRPVREILGDNVIPLRISEPPKANSGRNTDGSLHTQTTASSGRLASVGSPVEVKLESSASLIDFDDPDPPLASTVPHAAQTTIAQTTVQPASSTSDNNWASFDFAPQAKVSQPLDVNSVVSALSGLSVPAAGLSANTTMPSVGGNSTASMFPFASGAPAAVPESLSTILPGASAATPGFTSMFPVSGGNSAVIVTQAGQWPNMQHHQPYLFPATGSHSSAQPYTPSVHGGSSNQPWNLSHASNAQGPLCSAVQAPQIVSKPAFVVTSGVLLQPSNVEEKTNRRTELPQDLFTANYPSVSIRVPGWHPPPYGMGFAMQYNTGVVPPMPAHNYSVPSHPPKFSNSANPFDLGDAPPPVQAPTFPSMGSLQGALPNVPPSSSLPHASSFDAPSPAWMPPQPSHYTPAMPSQAPSYASSMPPGPYLGQQLPSNMPPSRHQGVGGFGTDSSNYQQPTRDPFSSSGGNPFD